MIESAPISSTIRRKIMWALLNTAALVKGIGPAPLQRVKDYLDSKFGIRMNQSKFPGQRPRTFFPGLRAVPVYETDRFDWTKKLEQHASEIRDEFLALRANGVLKPHPQELADSGNWNTYYFYSYGHKYEDHCQKCPVTSGILAKIDDIGLAGQAYFSVMSAGTHVTAHCGPTNTRIRCHLGLIVPETSVIRVDQEKYHWRELGCFVFDDSFEHEVWNPDAERAVLIIDLWHPDLTEEERWALATIHKLTRRNRVYRRGIKSRR